MRQKEALFNSINKEYLAQQQRKENERASAEAADKNRVEDEAAQAEGRARYLKRKRGRKRRRGEAGGSEAGADLDEPTTEEALLAAVSTRKISRKINYDAMSAIFDDSGGFTTDGIEESAVADAEFEMI